jgi:fumarylpyruvate hydrolase
MSSPEFVVALPSAASLPIIGSSKRFPVGRIFCVGRNYADHAREMGHDPNREPPFFFMKPPSAVVADGRAMPYPPHSADLHHEVEMIVALGAGGSNVPVERALEQVLGYGVGLDMTCRDVQNVAKKLSRPWETSKAFDHSAPCSALRLAAAIGHPAAGRIELRVNDAIRQEGDLSQMIWSVPEQIAYLSTVFALQPGDLIFSGTPAGVAGVQRGDRLHASVDGVADLSFAIA